MKILHVSFSAPPDPGAGTEVYVASLVRGLAAEGTTSVVAAPAASDASLEVDGLSIRRFAVGQAPLTLEALYGAGDAQAAASFGRLLDRERPDVVHLHAFTAACSVQLVDAAADRHIPVVLTYHTPAVSCQRGTLLKCGRSVCDGRLDASTCTTCVLQAHGVAPPLGRVLSWIPSGLSMAMGRAGLAGGAWTAVRMRHLMDLRIAEVRRLLSSVDRIVVLTGWVGDLLRRNGVAETRLVTCAHGIHARPEARSARPSGGPLRIVHVGRLDPSKGTHVLVEAVHALPGLDLALDIYGIVQSDANERHRERLQTMIASDSRIRLLDPIRHENVIATLAAYDVVAVPSQILETGPLVALEAFAAGVPVIASDLGNLRSLVQHDISGLLIGDYRSAGGWAGALQRCVEDRAAVERWRMSVPIPRTVADVAREMQAVYASLRCPPSSRADDAAVRVRQPA